MKGLLVGVLAVVIGVAVCIGALFLAPCPADAYCSVCMLDMGDWTGSGTLVGLDGKGRALILTCRHVAASEGAAADVMFPATGFYSKGRVTTIIGGDGFSKDLAMIVCNAPPGLKPLPISKFDEKYAPFRTVGYRDGKMFESIAVSAEEQPGGLIELDKPLIGGMSGGPVIDSRGCVVAVGVGTTKTFSVAADGEALVNLVEGYKK